MYRPIFVDVQNALADPPRDFSGVNKVDDVIVAIFEF